jgi:hypothetical protein
MSQYVTVSDRGLPGAEFKAKFEIKSWPHSLVKRSPAIQRTKLPKIQHYVSLLTVVDPWKQVIMFSYVMCDVLHGHALIIKINNEGCKRIRQQQLQYKYFYE